MHNKHKTAFQARKIKVIGTFEKQASDLLLENPSTRDVGATLRRRNFNEGLSIT